MKQNRTMLLKMTDGAIFVIMNFRLETVKKRTRMLGIKREVPFNVHIVNNGFVLWQKNIHI